MELNASHQRILSEGMPKLWNRIVACLRATMENCEIKGITSTFATPTTDSVRVSIFGTHSAVPRAIMDVRFNPEDYKIECFFPVPSGAFPARALFFTVTGGRVSLREGAEPLPDDEGNNVAEVVCQRLLEPLLRLLI